MLIVWEEHLLMMCCVVLFGKFFSNFIQLVEALWLDCHCKWDSLYGSARCASALFHSILSVIIRMIFPPVARQRGINRVVFGWSDGLCGSPLSSLGTSPVVGHGA